VDLDSFSNFYDRAAPVAASANKVEQMLIHARDKSDAKQTSQLFKLKISEGVS
jgi:hypothetical protein